MFEKISGTVETATTVVKSRKPNFQADSYPDTGESGETYDVEAHAQ